MRKNYNMLSGNNNLQHSEPLSFSLYLKSSPVNTELPDTYIRQSGIYSNNSFFNPRYEYYTKRLWALFLFY